MREAVAVLLLLGGEGRFFERRDVDYWGTRRTAAREEAPAEPLWADSTAPAPVRRLLDDPTRANAEAYLAWQSARLGRLREAIGAVEEARRAAAPPAILYFARAGCRFCDLQERELRGLPVTRVPEGSPLWERYAVTVTPTLVAGSRVFRGLTSREALLREAGRE